MKRTMQAWELIRPDGTIVLAGRGKMETNPPPLATLEGKTVALLWNGKTNGDIFLGRVGALLAQRAKDMKVLKLWEVDAETCRYGPGAFPPQIISKVKNLGPDIVIGAQCD